VIESDDWGSIRMPSKAVYRTMIKGNLITPNNAFAKYDSLASEDDLEHLFDLLTTFKDFKQNHPVFTANCVLANPDFHKIRDNNFETYFFEPFTSTLNEYPKHKRSFELWKEGYASGVFYPQFHGREHINVDRWIRNLKEGHTDLIKAFNLNTFFVETTVGSKKNANIAAALDMDDYDDTITHEKILSEGYQMFKSIFGYDSKSFIAPNYIWHPSVEQKLERLGIKYIQSSKFQNIPLPGKEGYKRRFIYTGKRNKTGQIYMTRNCYFEPSLNSNPGLIDSCIHSISNAFFWGKPAIISSHRLNYVGFIHEQNRDKNLILLKEFLTKILKKWPDVEFVNSAQLGDIIAGNE
jgi:hypothetical protein